MNAERDCRDPAKRSTLARRSFDSVIDVFSFRLPLCYYPAYALRLPLVVIPHALGVAEGNPVALSASRGCAFPFRSAGALP